MGTKDHVLLTLHPVYNKSVLIWIFDYSEREMSSSPINLCYTDPPDLKKANIQVSIKISRNFNDALFLNTFMNKNLALRTYWLRYQKTENHISWCIFKWIGSLFKGASRWSNWNPCAPLIYFLVYGAKYQEASFSFSFVGQAQTLMENKIFKL